MESLNEMFQDVVQDIHSAEKQIIKALPKVIKNCKNEQLKSGLQDHLEQTKSQAERIEQLCKTLGFKPGGKMCKGMQGVLAEGEEHLGSAKPGPATDAMIIADCQKVEMYEICNYGTAAAWAEQIGMAEAKQVLGQILQEEKDANELLNRVAEGSVNQQAAQVAEMSMDGKAKTGSASRKTSQTPASKASMR